MGFLALPGIVRIKTITTWKFPSPTWPTMGQNRNDASSSFFVASMHSASLEIGTATSCTHNKKQMNILDYHMYTLNAAAQHSHRDPLGQFPTVAISSLPGCMVWAAQNECLRARHSFSLSCIKGTTLCNMKSRHGIESGVNSHFTLDMRWPGAAYLLCLSPDIGIVCKLGSDLPHNVNIVRDVLFAADTRAFN